MVLHLKRKEADDIPPKLTRANFAENPVLLANTPPQAESQLHSLEQATGGIGLYINTKKEPSLL